MYQLDLPNGDITEDDWEAFFGMPRLEYVEPIREAYVNAVPLQVGRSVSRNDIIRPVFMQHTHDLADQDAATSFYEHDWYQKLLAFEFGSNTLFSMSKADRHMSSQNVYE